MPSPIDVFVSFRGKRIQPLSFTIGNRTYDVKHTHLVHAERRGREKVYIFSVSDDANAFRLTFSTETLAWNLEEAATL